MHLKNDSLDHFLNEKCQKNAKFRFSQNSREFPQEFLVALVPMEKVRVCEGEGTEGKATCGIVQNSVA